MHMCACCPVVCWHFRGRKIATGLRRFHFEDHHCALVLYPLILHKRHQAWLHSGINAGSLQREIFTLCRILHILWPCSEWAQFDPQQYLVLTFLRCILELTFQSCWWDHSISTITMFGAISFFFSPLQSWATVADKWEPSPILYIDAFS